MLNKNVQEKYLDIVKTKKEDKESVRELNDIINSTTEKIPNFGKREEPAKGFSTQSTNNIGFQYSSQQVGLNVQQNYNYHTTNTTTINNNISKFS
jgi:hypothetical protein